MAKTIAVSDETYEMLKKVKAENESFSQVIQRSLKKRGKLSDLVGRGTLSKADWKRTKDEIREAEKLTRKKLETNFG